MELYNVRNIAGQGIEKGDLGEKTDSDSNTLYLNDSISKETNFLKILNNV